MDVIYLHGCYSFKIATGYIVDTSCAKIENNFVTSNL